MAELLNAYLTADRLGSALAILAVGIIFAAVKNGERVRPSRKSSDG
jgi:hypothetical protein